MNHKVKQKYLINEIIGIHKIIAILNVREVKGKKRKAFDLFYKTKCTECGAIREIAQKSINNDSKTPPYYCINCPQEIKAAGRKRKQKEYEEQRNKKTGLTDEENQLYNLFVFKRKLNV